MLTSCFNEIQFIKSLSGTIIFGIKQKQYINIIDTFLTQSPVRKTILGKLVFFIYLYQL